MVQKNFGIYGSDLNNCNLFIETGQTHIACWMKDNESGKIKAFEMFSFPAKNNGSFETLLNEITLHSRLFTSPFEQCYCIWEDERHVCVPAEFYTDDAATSYLDLMFGNMQNVQYCKDTLDDFVTLAAINNNALSAMDKKFHVAAHAHKFYSLLKLHDKESLNDFVKVVFYSTHFILVAYKQGKLQLIQRFAYTTKEDVLYHILNVCSNFKIDAATATVKVTGMIDENSSLYQTLHAYIKELSAETPDASLYEAEEFHQYPLHYFHSFCGTVV
ncbi:MAG TPA: DUF3822 family protein [Chitinophagaceae bacterium]|nr:DUF3822 family protein [Chitinophagaceae bacterium]